jgi:hypothetical protein
MSRSLGTLTLDLVAKVGGFVEGLSKAERESKKRSSAIQKNIKQIRGGLDAAAKSAAGLAAAYAASMVLIVNRGREAGDQQAKLAQRFNTTSEAIGTLTRAGQLTGTTLEQIGTAGRQLDVNLAKAAQGTGAQADALDRLGLSAQKLQSMALDDRIATINEALRTNVSASERAAIAADLFGSRSAQAISLIDTSVIETARKESELFGHALSDIDAAKIEIANDAMSRISSAAEGFSKQMALQFAPALKAIGDLFLDAAEDAGGMGTIADRVFKGMVSGVGFVLDAIRGLQVVVKGIQLAFSAVGTVVSQVLTRILDGFIWITESAAKMVRNIIDGANKILEPFGKAIPTTLHDSIIAGTEIASKAMADIRQSSLDATKTIGAEMHELMMQQMPSEALKEKIAEYQGITDEAAAFELERRAAYQAQITEIEQDGAESRVDVAEWELQEKLAKGKNILGQLSTLMNGHSRKLFEVGKIAAIAGAVISGIEATQDAFKWGMKIGGPPLAGAFAGAAALATGARIQQIARTKFGGGSAGVSNTQSVSAGAAPAMTTQDQMPTRNVYFSGISPDEFYRGDMIIEAIDTELRNGGRFAGIIA